PSLTGRSSAPRRVWQASYLRYRVQGKGGGMADGPGSGSPVAVPTRSALPWWATLCVFLVIACGAGGFFHVVYGGHVGFTVCSKDGWALEDTFVDVSDYAGKPLIALVPKAKVVRALIACEILERPRFGRSSD